MPHTSLEIMERWMDPKFKFFINRKGSVQAREIFLRKDKRMQDEYLGACLDYVRWGGQMEVMYELGTPGIIGFVQHWMKENEGNLIWNDKKPDKNFSLPYKPHDTCKERKSHKEVVEDGEGRTRCANDSCYKVISEREIILPLEEVLDRLNKESRLETVYCPKKVNEDNPKCRGLEYFSRDEMFHGSYNENCLGHEREKNITIHPFSGWTLAHYVQKWHEQSSSGKASVFK